ncbi:MAG: hypothetical protein HYZ58_19745 [Acidobacteria bacterium]|nr:hypothetical protein [Acidobacteriota bacterium]MBI3265369.1 hypothetical protein [Acidobacteriota bacterium]
MSGQAAVELLRAYFERVRSAELVRLQKKFSRLSDAERHEVDAITAGMVEALASRFQDGFTRASEPHVDAVMNLFRLSNNPDDPSVR